MLDDVNLPPVWIVGFTGHRHLQNPEGVGGIIRAELEKLRKEMQGEIEGYSSAAIGADTLFAEACQSLNIPWTATLPFAPTDFRQDFNESEWSQTAGLLSRAVEVEISGSSEDRNGAYLRCGLRTVDGADIVMAVWDGQPPRGTGGTGEIVAYARTQNKPLILIDPGRLKVERELFRDNNSTDDR